MKMILEGTEDERREVLEALKRNEELLAEIETDRKQVLEALIRIEELLQDVAEEKVSQLSEEG